MRRVGHLGAPLQPHPRARTPGASGDPLGRRGVFLNSLPPEMGRAGPSDPRPSSQVVGLERPPGAAGQ